MSNIQVVNLADNINAAILKINQNFAGLDSAVGNITIDSADITNIINNVLDSDSDRLTAVASEVTQLGVDLNQFITDGITITPEQVTQAAGGALEELTTRLDADSDKLVIESQKIVDLDASLTAIDSDLGVRIDAEADARTELSSTVSYQGGLITSTSNSLTELDNAIFVRDPVTGEVTSNAITNAVSDLRTEIVQENGLIQSALSTERTSITAEIDGEIATLNNDLRSYVDAQTGNTVAQWTLDLTAGDADDPYVAGLKFTNDSRTADFVLSADTFKLVTPTASNGSGGISPFSVDATGVKLSNATVTGQIDIGTGITGTSHMEITNDRIDIYDGNVMRVRLGNLV